MKKLILSLMLLPLITKAGIESVGNGGGFAEMQAYAIDRGLPTLLKYCAGSRNPCELNEPEQLIVQNLAQSKELLQAPLLRINETCEKPYLHLESNKVYSLDACSLYSESTSAFGPIPLANNEIAAKVIETRVLSFAQDVSNHQAHELAKQLSLALKFEDQQTIIPVNGYIFRLHIWSLQFAKQNLQSLTVETLTRSWDIGSEIEKTLQCSQEFNFHLSGFRFQSSTSGSLGKSEIQWSCGTQKYKALLYLDLYFEDAEMTDLALNLFKKERL